MSNGQPRIGILMGSDSDLEVMREAEKRLDTFGIGYETRIMSAHRTPEKAAEYAATAQSRGLQAIICGAGADLAYHAFEREGAADQVEGQVQDAFGRGKRKVGEAIEDVGDRIKR